MGGLLLMPLQRRRAHAILWLVGGLLVSLLAVGVGGQEEIGDTGDTEDTGGECGCIGAVVAACLIIGVILSVLFFVGACVYIRIYHPDPDPHEGYLKKVDVEGGGLSRAAYDNPHFQPDEGLDVPDGVVLSSSGGGGVASAAAASSAPVNIAGPNTGQEKGMSTLEK